MQTKILGGKSNSEPEAARVSNKTTTWIDVTEILSRQFACPRAWPQTLAEINKFHSNSEKNCEILSWDIYTFFFSTHHTYI